MTKHEGEEILRYDKSLPSYLIYYIRVYGCNNPEVNDGFYFGPPLYSAGSENGIQGDRSGVGYSDFLRPVYCPPEARAFRGGRFIELRYLTSKTAICNNSECLFACGRQQQSSERPLTEIPVIKKILRRKR